MLGYDKNGRMRCLMCEGQNFAPCRGITGLPARQCTRCGTVRHPQAYPKDPPMTEDEKRRALVPPIV